MSLSEVKALAFDTGGTVLDWHSGIHSALAEAGARHGLTRDWPVLTNDYRALSAFCRSSCSSPRVVVQLAFPAPATTATLCCTSRSCSATDAAQLGVKGDRLST